MTKNPKPPYPYVRVRWLDAYSEDAWVIVDDYELHDHAVDSSGYVVKENATYILLAPTVGWNAHEEHWEMATAIAIPRGMIIPNTFKVLKRAPRAAVTAKPSSN